MSTVSFVIATSGRPTLSRTLASIDLWDGDEILVVCDEDVEIRDPRCRVVRCPRGNDWGHSERNFAREMAVGKYVSHMDDDDVYAAKHRVNMAMAIAENPDRPSVFCMRFWHGLILWQQKKLECGNVGTPMTLWPNEPEKFGTWLPYVGGDFAFIESSKWAPEDYVWRPEVIAHLRPALI